MTDDIKDIKKLGLPKLVKMMEDNRDDRFCFVIGSGASKNSGIATGADMARVWLKDIEANGDEVWIKENKITEHNAGEFYAELYEKRFYINPEDLKKVTVSCKKP